MCVACDEKRSWKILYLRLNFQNKLLIILFQACGGEFLSNVNYYSYGLMASMSITAMFEVFQILPEHYHYLTMLKVFEINAVQWFSDISQKV